MPDNGFVSDLAAIVGARGIVTDADAMAPFLEDWRGRRRGAAMAVLLPDTVDQVSSIVERCARDGAAIFPQGGNTGLCAGAVPSADGQGIVLALRRLKRIREIDAKGMTATVDAGVVLADLHNAADAAERSFPLHLGAEGTAQIGGLISTNAGGTGALRYGTMGDLVLGIEAVLANGERFDGLSALRKDNTGYDLKRFFIGAEGTLGIITGATVKLAAKARARADAWLAVSTPQHALDLLAVTQETFDADLHAFELCSASQIDAVLQHVPGRTLPFDETPAWNVMIELGTSDPEAPLETRLQTFLEAALERGIIADGIVARSLQQARDIWTVRHSVSEANRHAGHGITLDISVPVSRTADFIAGADDLLAAQWPQAHGFVVAHLGDGNVHYIPMFDKTWWADQVDADRVQADVLVAFHDLACRCSGSFSAEHGIGRKLSGELVRLTPNREMDLMRGVKRLFDPANLMNPGIMLDGG